jgi:ribosomal-protein-alanine N-acetyltransferase
MAALATQSPTAAHWPESFYSGLFEEGSPARISLVAEDDGVIHGFLIARITSDECELENVVVAEGLQRSGIGSGLIHALTDSVSGWSVTRIFLEVRESNAAARALYEKCGFQLHGRRNSYYKNPAEDAVLYVRVP